MCKGKVSYIINVCGQRYYPAQVCAAFKCACADRRKRRWERDRRYRLIALKSFIRYTGHAFGYAYVAALAAIPGYYAILYVELSALNRRAVYTHDLFACIGFGYYVALCKTGINELAAYIAIQRLYFIKAFVYDIPFQTIIYHGVAIVEITCVQPALGALLYSAQIAVAIFV